MSLKTAGKIALAVLFASAPFAAQAELVWTTDAGWQIKGGLLAGLGLDTEEKRQNALEKMNEAKRLQDKGKYGAAIGIYDDVIDDYPGSDFSAEAFYQRGNCRFLRNQFEKSFSDYEEIVRRRPEFSKFNDVIRGEYRVADAIKSGKRPYLWGRLPWFKDYKKGLEYFESVNRNAPYGRLATQALYDKGILALAIDENDTAIDAFERVINNYPDDTLVPDAYLALAKTCEISIIGPEWDQGATRNALNYYNDYISLFPQNPNAPEAVKGAEKMRETLARNRLDLGKFYYNRRNNSRAAAIFFNEVVNISPDSEAAKEAQEFLADIRAGKKAPRTLVDWFFGRYPETTSGDYIDAQSQANLDKMGFLTDSAKAKDGSLGVKDYNNDDT